MDRHKELGEFLRAKRAQIPVQGRPFGGTRRRVPGMRREEVASAALISTVYYTKLEQGRASGISAAVLDGLAGALHLTEEERAYVTTLIPVSGEGGNSGGSSGGERIAPALTRVMDSLAGVPAHLLNDRCDLVRANALGRALYPLHFDGQATPNVIRFLYLDPRAPASYVDWYTWASQGVAYLRSALASTPGDASLAAFVDEMRAASEDFDRDWETHRVRIAIEGVRRIAHPTVGQLDLDFQILRAAGHPRLRLICYTGEPGSVTAGRLAALAAAPAPSGGQG